ncbi:MAG: P-II family nitrogen regulator [Desulfohalobiaceae bacterium]
MQEVMAIIRQNRINQTKKALAEAGFAAMTAAKAQGRGRRSVEFQFLEAVTERPDISPDILPTLSQGGRLIPKRLVDVVIPDSRVQEVVQIIIDASQTGEPGDGKIFVLPVSEALRVRTGERNEAAIDEMQVAKEVL